MRPSRHSVRNSLVVGILTLLAFIGIGMAANAQAKPSQPAMIDEQGFLRVTEDALEARKERLIDLDYFNQMKAETGTIILDTRSAEAFAMGHIEGAINLPFSDFTDEKLAKTIANLDTRILIYCNNNFRNNVAPLVLKRVELALNIPTYINLHGYGYENIYELADLVDMNDPRVNWVSTFDLQQN